ncbi:Na+-dependent transporters of the SNF family protein [Candidatus Rubidus massiliensis]|nr:Na+-dependent transporters of the SNF family protein [Candidatus Rubidus massiliensis]
MSQISNSTWKSQTGYIWALIGSAVGFANVLSFSAQVYKNGGGAFLIPYFFALFLLGIPMLILEGKIGYKWKLPLITTFIKTGIPRLKMIGWLSVIACITIGAFYIVLTGYAVSYTFFAATKSIPEDTQYFFLHDFLHLTPSISEFGTISFPILFSTIVVCLSTWYVLTRRVQDGIEKICSFFMPIMVLIILIFAIVSCLLPGGINAFYYYLKPDFEKLYQPQLWRDIFGQLFFSLSLGLGIIIGYSRHTQKNTNIVKAMCLVAFGDFFVSFISGIAIFGCLSHISYVQNIPFSEIIKSDSTFEIGFILFPKILKSFGFFEPIIGTIFFFCIFIAGITGVFSIVECIVGNVEEEFRIDRKKAVGITLIILMSFSLFFCMGNGSHIIDALAPMVLGTNMLIGALGLILSFAYSKTLQVFDESIPTLLQICIKFIIPIILLVILISNLFSEITHLNFATNLRFAWLLMALIIGNICVTLTEKKRLSHKLYSN